MHDDTNDTNTEIPLLKPQAQGSLLLTSVTPKVFGAVLPTQTFNLSVETTKSIDLSNNVNNKVENNLEMLSNNTTNVMVINSGLQCLFGIPRVVGGIINYSQGNEFNSHPEGSVANLQCINGTRSIGPTTASCVNGLWSPMILGPCSLIIENEINTKLQQSKNI